MSQEHLKLLGSRDSSLDSQTSLRSYINRSRGRGRRFSIEDHNTQLNSRLGNTNQINQTNQSQENYPSTSTERLRDITDKLSSHLSSPTLVHGAPKQTQSHNAKRGLETSSSSSTKTPEKTKKEQTKKKKFRSIITGLDHQPNLQTSRRDPLINNSGIHRIPTAQTSSPIPPPRDSIPDHSTAQSMRQSPPSSSEENAKIFWKTNGLNKFTYSQHHAPPFLVIMESEEGDRNLGRYDPIAIGKLVANYVSGDRTIYVSGRNQVKIFCQQLLDANNLLSSRELADRGYKTLVPESLLYKKGFIRVLSVHSVTEMIENMDRPSKEGLAMAKRRMNRREGIKQDIIDLFYLSSTIPRETLIYSVSQIVTPSIPAPKRCFRCQTFGHVSTQCQANHPNCEFCGAEHSTDHCENSLTASRCVNCNGAHKSSSNTCPVYQYEFEIMKERWLNNLTEEEATDRLNAKGIYHYIIKESIDADSDQNNSFNPILKKVPKRHPILRLDTQSLPETFNNLVSPNVDECLKELTLDNQPQSRHVNTIPTNSPILINEDDNYSNSPPEMDLDSFTADSMNKFFNTEEEQIIQTQELGREKANNDPGDINTLSTQCDQSQSDMSTEDQTNKLIN